MTDHALWAPLATATIAPKDKTPGQVKNRLDKEEQKKADAALWGALDERDAHRLQEAIDAGARVEFRQKGHTPLQRALWDNQVDLARLLLDAGADLHAKHTRHYDVFQAALDNDSPAVAALLREKGIDPTLRIHYYGVSRKSPVASLLGNSPNLVRWWLEEKIPVSFADDPEGSPHTGFPKGLPEWVGVWSRQALVHAGRGLFDVVRDAMEKEDPVFAKNPAFATHMSVLWQEEIQKDNAPLLQQLARAGWTPSPTGRLGEVTEIRRTMTGHLEKIPRYDSVRVSMVWGAVSPRSLRCLDLLLSSPGIRIMVEDDLATKTPHLLCSTLTPSGPVLDRLLPLGLDLSIQNHRGNLLHNHPHSLTRVFAEWALRNHPGLLFDVNADGVSGLDACQPDPSLRAFIDKQAIRQAVGRAPARKPTPKSRRL
jgi:hypothetical protein